MTAREGTTARSESATAYPGTAIRAIRTALDLSQRDLGALAGTSYSYISLIERGKREPGRAWLRSVTEALAAHLIRVTGWHGEPQ